MRHARDAQLLSIGALALGLAAVGCEGSAAPCVGDQCSVSGNPAATSFESDLPSGSQNQNQDSLGTRGVANGAAPVPGVAPPMTPSGSDRAAGQAASTGSASSLPKSEAAGDDPARMISEADIIQVQGDTLYALSRMAGLAIIDVHDPSALKLLGRFRELPAEPFELYLRDGVALVMFSGWGQYVKSGDSYSWVSTSKLLALDVADPAHVASLGSFDVPGTISDSRLVGDILYVVSYENGYCYQCQQDAPRSSITSLSVADAHNVKKVDQLFYSDGSNQYGSGQKSITVTTDRMYVAGPEYGPNMPLGSTVQVVDISDPKGDLVEGAHVQVAGQISSRWQMDEYEGVLRVFSQPLQWWTSRGTTISLPSVETFKVESSSKLTALGKTDIQLPMPETLRSARFDGPRAYVITAEQKDPLFTIDLSDPSAPRQAGSLILPGFIWHMQPRGDRLLAIGFDQGNAMGSIVASLFDVTTLDQPKLLSQAHFGGMYGNLPEDQDRAEKVIRVFDDAGLLLVPFSGWSPIATDPNALCKGGGNSLTGVQLIDFKDDALKSRGTATVSGQARRGFLQHESLLSVSDERVQAFDIGDRDAPKQTSEVVMASQVFQAHQLDNGIIARLSYDSNYGQPHLDFVGSDDAGEPNLSLAELDLSSAGGTSTSSCTKGFSLDQVLVEGSQLNLLYNTYDNSGASQTQQSGLIIVDASKPAAPAIVSDTHWNNDQSWQPYYGYYNYGFYNTGSSVVRTRHAINVLEVSWVYTPISSMQNTRLRVLDLRDPAHVKTTTLPLELAMYSGLVAAGDTVLTSHIKPTDNNVARGRFYIDRFDVSDPSAPKKQASVNVPGALMYYDGATQRAITSEQKLIAVPDLTYDQCMQRFGLADWAYSQNGSSSSGGVGVAIAAPRPAAPPGSAGASVPSQPIETPPPPTDLCNGYQQNLHLLQLTATSASVVDSLKLDEDEQVSSLASGDDVVFASIGHGGIYGRGGIPLPALDIACIGACGGGTPNAKPSEVLVLGGLRGATLEVGRLTTSDDTTGWWGFWGSPPVYASGKLALALSQSDAAIIDATDPTDPKIVKRVTLIASPNYVDVKDDTALLTLGAQGVQWLSLK